MRVDCCETHEKRCTILLTYHISIHTCNLLYLVKGDYSIRLLALVVGFALLGESFFDFLGEIVKLNFSGALMSAYSFILGVIMIVLESRQLQVDEGWLKKIYKYALFLKFVWGRGILYFVAGTITMAQGEIGDLIVGGLAVGVGLLYIYIGRETASKLKALRSNLQSEQTLRAKFREADIGGTGNLSLPEFRTILVSLGMNMTRGESEAAFLTIDRTDVGEISFEDFRAWWNDWDEDHASQTMIV